MLATAAALAWALPGLPGLPNWLSKPTPPPAEANPASPWGQAYFPNPVLTDQNGRQWRFYDDLVKGKAIAINTFFTVCTDVCPLGTAKMRALQRQLGERVGRDIFFYSLSVDPLRDSPEAMKAYAQRYDIGPGWLFLTGREEDIRLITRKLGLGRLQQSDARESHSATLMVGDEPSGRWMKNASTDNPQYLAAHMATFLGWPVAANTARQAEARPLRLSEGEFVFRNACSACHTIGGGAGIGPDLHNVQQRRPRAWLERFIQAPDRLLAEGDPTARALLAQHRGVQMPNLGLSAADVQQLLQYIAQRSAKVSNAQPDQPPARLPDNATTLTRR